MNEPLTKVVGQLAAHEYLLQRLYMITYATLKIPPEQIQQSHANMRKMILATDWPGTEPGLAALASGEIEDSINSFLSGLESMLVEKGLLPEG